MKKKDIIVREGNMFQEKGIYIASRRQRQEVQYVLTSKKGTNVKWKGSFAIENGTFIMHKMTEMKGEGTIASRQR